MHFFRQKVGNSILNWVIKRTFATCQETGQYFIFIFLVNLEGQLTFTCWAADYVHEFPLHAVQKVVIYIIIMVIKVQLRAGD